MQGNETGTPPSGHNWCELKKIPASFKQRPRYGPGKWGPVYLGHFWLLAVCKDCGIKVALFNVNDKWTQPGRKECVPCDDYKMDSALS